MLQSITTKYFGPTNFNGSRIKATAQAGSITVSYDHRFNEEQNHALAAAELLEKLGWQNNGSLHGGGGANGYHFVFVNNQSSVYEIIKRAFDRIERAKRETQTKPA